MYSQPDAASSTLCDLLALLGTCLRKILFSDAFYCHMKSLVHLLKLPTSGHLKEYHQFAEAHGISFQGYRGKQKVDDVSSKDGDKKPGFMGITGRLFKAGNSKQDGVSNEDMGSGATADEDDDSIPDATNELSDHLPANVTTLESSESPWLEPTELRKTISSWLKLLVKYHTAQSALESYCRTLEPGDNANINIKLLEIKPRQGSMPTWDAITQAIDSVIKRTQQTNLRDINPKDFIDYIFTDVCEIVDSKRSYHSILHKFSDIMRNIERPVSYTVHCEAALVAFASAGDKSDAHTKIEGDRALCKLWKVCALFIPE